MKKVTSNLEKIIKPVALKNGFNEVKIFSSWKNIIGSELHSQVKPIKLKNKVLHVMVQNSAVATDIAFKSPILIEKINQFFGYKAVEKITTLQKSFKDANGNEYKTIVPDQGSKVRANAMCSNVKDEKLRKALSDYMALIEQETMDNFKKNSKK
tara:strand:+ start:661 stop:1122 length:462 start_codon:yes stop_codon:yes gene_type:complete